MPSVVAAIAVLQSTAQTPQSHLAPMIGAVALVIAALIAALGTYWAQSKRFERFESDLSAQAARIRQLEDEFKRDQRLLRLETDLILLFGSKNISSVMRVWIEAFTNGLALEAEKAVTFAVYLRRVADDEMMRRMKELIESQRAEDIRNEYENLKRKLGGG